MERKLSEVVQVPKKVAQGGFTKEGVVEEVLVNG